MAAAVPRLLLYNPHNLSSANQKENGMESEKSVVMVPILYGSQLLYGEYNNRLPYQSFFFFF